MAAPSNNPTTGAMPTPCPERDAAAAKRSTKRRYKPGLSKAEWDRRFAALLEREAAEAEANLRYAPYVPLAEASGIGCTLTDLTPRGAARRTGRKRRT